jgi:hypothetical protein
MDKEDIDKYIKRLYLEKELGDLKNESGECEEAIKHYKNSILVLGVLFEEEALFEDETRVNKLIDEIGVSIRHNV